MTKRAGVIGHPLEHSKSPAMFEAAFRAAGIDAQYEAWDTPEDVLAGRIEALRGSDFLGANITIPHKQAVLSLIDGAVGDASKVGAVNTIVHENDKLIGHNTDVAGFTRALKEDAKFEAHGRRTMILGSGGAARAVALALVQERASTIFVIGRHPRRTEQTVLQLKPGTPAGTTISWAYWGDGSYQRSVREADLIVNCTPIGMAGGEAADASPIDADLIDPEATVFDLVYNPLETPLLKAARGRGATTASGIGMLVYQGAASFKLWTGQEADIAAMREALQAALSSA